MLSTVENNEELFFLLHFTLNFTVVLRKLLTQR